MSHCAVSVLSYVFVSHFTVHYVVAIPVQFSPPVSPHWREIFHDLLDIQVESPLVWSDSEGCDLGRVTPLQMYHWPRPGSRPEFTGVQLEKHLLPWSSPPIHHHISSPFTSLSIPISLHLLLSAPGLRPALLLADRKGRPPFWRDRNLLPLSP